MDYFIRSGKLLATFLLIAICYAELTIAETYSTSKHYTKNNTTANKKHQQINNQVKDEQYNNADNGMNSGMSNDMNSTMNNGKDSRDSDFIHSYITPTTIGFASYLLPGAGQLMNGEPVKAVFQASLYYALDQKQRALKRRNDYNDSMSYFSDDRIAYRTKTMQTYFTLETLSQQEKAYSAFDAFRTARHINEAHGVVYIQPVSNETFTDLALAPFDYNNLIQPLVFLPLLAISVTALANIKSDPYSENYKNNIVNNDNYISPTNNRDLDYMYGTTFVDAMSVGVGEEVLFRGFLFPSFTELSGNVVWGGFLSSALFGMMHAGVGSQASSLEAFTTGSYFAFVSYYNNFNLAPSIALHSWWDTLLMLSTIKKNKSKIKFDKYGNPIKQTYRVASFGFAF